MMLLLGLWYYLVAGVFFALVGALAHVTRALFNLYPDRLTDKPWLDMAISEGYDLNDRLFGTEYDDAGFYRLDSGRNLAIAVLSSLAAGWGAMLFWTDLAVFFAHSVDQVFAWIGELYMRRLQAARWV